ncbi:uncharacterized protein LOC128242320 [Mya arenaria]|uniref:uncharacterized protein LOC128242320 n=1 Tax=Mya arenaria TaxID=6604 RepID=UPI0022E9895F|nr:uncharacterized protein LOC128242320 [Mya arenaria]
MDYIVSCGLLLTNWSFFLLGLLIGFSDQSVAEIKKYTLCNEKVDMEAKGIQQGELELAINTNTGSDSRVSCDFTVTAENGRHVMFYFTDLFLGSPNFTERVDRACIEPRDINGNYETFLAGMRPYICSRTQVDIGSKVYATTGNALSLRFYRNRGYGIRVYVKLVFTAFRLGSCRTTERKCNNERCIAHDIVCNDRNPCGDNSDCPTGLEHLSSWAMSGIVILALLCGGIVIIMATVCLQRAGNKNYDLDDVTIPANGMVHHECPHVEMNEVPNIDKKPNTNFDRGSKRQSFNESNNKLSGSTEEGEDEDLLRAESDSQCRSDREKLIQTLNNSTLAVDKAGMLKDDQFKSKKPTHVVTVKTYSNGSGTSSSMINNRGGVTTFTGAAQSDTRVDFNSNSNATRPHSSGLYFSEHSLVFSDSDSGNEDENRLQRVHDFSRQSLKTKYVRPFDDHISDVKAIELNTSSEMLVMIQPPPPPYGV